MPARTTKKSTARKPSSQARPARPSGSARTKPPGADTRAILAALKQLATQRTLDAMSRYAIASDNALGVSMGDIQGLAKRVRKEHGERAHDLADPLWDTGVYEARTLVAYIADPARLTGAQMDRWRKDFDTWAICDTLCFALFDRTPHAWAKVALWGKPAKRAHPNDEFHARAPLALLASLAGHDKAAPDSKFLDGLRFIERTLTKPPDGRNFVIKGASWALRRIGWRNAALHGAAAETATRLAASPHPGARWVGKDALRDITRPAVTRRFAPKKGRADAKGRGAS